MAYRAQRPSLFGEVGGPDAPSGGGVDYGRLVDALTNGASSLIQQAYLRKMQQRTMAREDAATAYSHSRDAAQDRRDAERLTFDRDKFTHEKAMNRADLLYKGYHDQPHQRSAPNIAKAMLGVAGGGLPDQITATQTDPHYDVDRSIPYRTATDRAAVTAEAAGARQADRLSSQRSNIEFLARAREDLAKWKVQHSPTRGGIARAMTGNQLNTFNQSIARGLLETNGGDVNRVIEDFRATPADQRPEGMKEEHIVAAYGTYIKGATGQVLRTQAANGVSVPEAAATRDSVVKALTPPPIPKKPAAVQPAAPAPTTGGRLRAPATTPAPTNNAAPVKAAPVQQGGGVDTIGLKNRMVEARASGSARDAGPGDPKHDLAIARRDSLSRARAGALPVASAAAPAAKRTPDQAAQGAAKLIQEKKITLEAALKSPYLSDSAKTLLRKQFTAGKN